MLSVNNLSKSFGSQTIFSDISFILNRHEKVGLVGRNGSGKSTLFKLITKEIEADSGNIKIPKDYRIGTLEQHIKFTKQTVLEECVQALSQEEQYDHYKAEKILSGLGFSEADFHKSPNVFSGGYQIRITLIKALLANPNLLLLDEPTNYLDILSIRWLGNFLKTFEGEILLITHDSYFMDKVITHTMGISREKIRKINGNTSKYYNQIKADEEVYEQTRINHEKKKKDLERFITRFKAKASKATQAQSKMKQLAKMGHLDQLSQEQAMSLRFEFTACPGKILFKGENLAFSYSSKKEDFLFKNLTFNIFNQDRIGIIGKNGKGKSTLLNLLAQVLKPVEGEISTHPLVKIGHFGQTNIERLHPENNVIQEISNSNPELPQSKIRQICGSMMFSDSLAEKKVKILSGGERSRILIGKIIAHPTNLLLLDEPTNHLDMESIKVLGNELTNYKGAVVLVTHNEWLLKNLINKLIIFQQNKTFYFEGNYQEFLEKVGWEDENLDGKAKLYSKKGKKYSYKEIKQKRSQITQERIEKTKPLKKEINKIENTIQQIEFKLEAKNKQLLLVSSQEGRGEEIKQISIEIGQLSIEMEKLFDKLEKPMQNLDDMQASYKIQLEELKIRL